MKNFIFLVLGLSIFSTVHAADDTIKLSGKQADTLASAISQATDTFYYFWGTDRFVTDSDAAKYLEEKGILKVTYEGSSANDQRQRAKIKMRLRCSVAGGARELGAYAIRRDDGDAASCSIPVANEKYKEIHVTDGYLLMSRLRELKLPATGETKFSNAKDRREFDYLVDCDLSERLRIKEKGNRNGSFNTKVDRESKCTLRPIWDRDSKHYKYPRGAEQEGAPHGHAPAN